MCDDCEKCCSMFMCCMYMFTGIGLLGVGIWMPVDTHVYDSAVMYNPVLMTEKIAWHGAVGGMMALGAWCIITGILGMAATGCSSKSALIAFLVLGSIGVIGVMVYGGIISARFATRPYDEVSATMQENILTNFKDENSTDEYTQAWNRFQVQYECCGVGNFTDYENSEFYNTTGGDPAAPWSCCVMTDQKKNEIDIGKVVDLTTCRAEASTPPTTFTSLNDQGCESALVGSYKDSQLIVMCICWVCVFLQIVSLIAAGCLKSDLKIDMA